MRQRTTRAYVFLMEILFGICLFGGAILLALGMYPGAVNSLTQSKKINLATNLARQVMESTISRPFSDINSVAAAPDTVVTYTTENRGVTSTHEFVYDIDCTNVVGGGDLKSVRVNVRWKHQDVDRTVTLQCYKAPF